LDSLRSIGDVPKLEDSTGILDARRRPAGTILRVALDVGCDQQREAVRTNRYITVSIQVLPSRTTRMSVG
jgi:hypothetical protein